MTYILTAPTHTHHTEFLNLQMQLDKGTSKKSVESTT